MIATLGTQIGLLAFSTAIFAGMYAGNSPFTILSRALIVMALGVLVGQLAAGAARAVIREHLQARKTKLDREHYEAIKRAESTVAETAGRE